VCHCFCLLFPRPNKRSISKRVAVRERRAGGRPYRREEREEERVGEEKRERRVVRVEGEVEVCVWVCVCDCWLWSRMDRSWRERRRKGRQR